MELDEIHISQSDPSRSSSFDDGDHFPFQGRSCFDRLMMVYERWVESHVVRHDSLEIPIHEMLKQHITPPDFGNLRTDHVRRRIESFDT